jgi:hypothetical protein
VTRIVSAKHVSRGSNCALEILTVEPSKNYRKIAIVEGWSGTSDQNELWSEIKQQGCEIGADALLVVSEEDQEVTHLVYDPANADPSRDDEDAIDQNPGKRIASKEHVPRIGEVGHSGYYVETYAIVQSRAN